MTCSGTEVFSCVVSKITGSECLVSSWNSRLLKEAGCMSDTRDAAETRDLDRSLSALQLRVDGRSSDFVMVLYSPERCIV